MNDRKAIEEMMKRLSGADLDAFPAVSPFEDAEVISSYSRAEAIEDGVLMDVSAVATEVGITVHTAVTPGVMSELVSNPKWSDWGTEQDRLKRLLNCAANAIESTKNGDALFSIEFFKEDNPVQRIDLRAVRGPGDSLEQVMTVMLMHED